MENKKLEDIEGSPAVAVHEPKTARSVLETLRKKTDTPGRE